MAQNYLITDSVPRLSLDSLPLIEGKTPLIIDGNPVVAINRNTLGERTQNIATDKFQSYVVPSYTGYQPVAAVPTPAYDRVQNRKPTEVLAQEMPDVKENLDAQTAEMLRKAQWRRDFEAGKAKYNGYTREEGLALQKKLQEAGFYKGALDGMIGAKSQAALAKYQEMQQVQDRARKDALMMRGMNKGFSLNGGASVQDALAANGLYHGPLVTKVPAVAAVPGSQPVSSVLEAEQIARAYLLGSMNEDPIRIRKQGGIISYVDYLK